MIMAEIKNYTLNFGSGRAHCALPFAVAKLACTEIEGYTGLRNKVVSREMHRG
jgi:hypothetical protein